jgi:hypothetical protein
MLAASIIRVIIVGKLLPVYMGTTVEKTVIFKDRGG